MLFLAVLVLFLLFLLLLVVLLLVVVVLLLLLLLLICCVFFVFFCLFRNVLVPSQDRQPRPYGCTVSTSTCGTCTPREASVRR